MKPGESLGDFWEILVAILQPPLLPHFFEVKRAKNPFNPSRILHPSPGFSEIPRRRC